MVCWFDDIIFVHNVVVKIEVEIYFALYSSTTYEYEYHRYILVHLERSSNAADYFLSTHASICCRS